MTKFAVFAIVFIMNYIGYGLLALIYVYPRLRRMPLKNALLAMVSIHMIRQLGLYYLHPSLTGADPHSAFALLTAYGDLLSSLLAMVAVLGLYRNASWSVAMVWVFNVVGFLDLLDAYALGIKVHSWNFLVNLGWFVPLFIVPILMISHILIFMLLIRKSDVSAAVV